MGQTKTMTVTGAADVAVQAVSFCAVIAVREDPSVNGWPTAAYTIKKPTSSDQPITCAVGEGYTFRASDGTYFQPGSVVGYIRLAAAGSTTISQDES